MILTPSGQAIPQIMRVVLRDRKAQRRYGHSFSVWDCMVALADVHNRRTGASITAKTVMAEMMAS